jgi:hypothetical protein
MMASTSVAIMPPMIGWGGQGLSIAIAQIDSDAPSVLGSWTLEGDAYSDISDVFAKGDLLAFSYQQSETIQGKTAEWIRGDAWTATSLRSWLQVVDLADPSAPMPWAPVQVPGSLVSISDWTRAGATVFTRSGDRIAALGFNGETASVVAEVDAGFAHVMIGSTLFAAFDQGISRREFSSLNGIWNPSTAWMLDQASAIHSLVELDGGLAAISHNQAWILGADQSFVGHDILSGANFNAAARSDDAWIVPAGDYGPLLLEP